MPKTAQREEIEIKLRVPDVAAVRRQLKHLQAREIAPRTHESNTLYDTPRHDLKRRGRLIRIRIERPASSFGETRPDENAAAVLTYKGPPRLSRNTQKPGRHSKIRGHFKIKDEAEVLASPADRLPRILRGIGLQPVFRYEKFRTTYALRGVRGLKIELDETPIGIYLELEGPVAGIHRAARLLGYRREDYLKDSYGSLYLGECRRHGLTPSDMLFPPIKKLR
jgi:adenylate cyclase class 2